MKKRKPRRCADCGRVLASKREALTCEGCHGVYCGQHVFIRVDGNNGSITQNAPWLCRACFQRAYGEAA